MSANERPATSQRCHGQGRVCYMPGARDDGCESAPYSTVLGLTLNLISLGLLALEKHSLNRRRKPTFVLPSWRTENIYGGSRKTQPCSILTPRTRTCCGASTS